MKLASGNPRTPALIDPKYLSEPAELDLLMEGVSLAREIGAGAAFANWRAQEVYPGPGRTTTADMRKFVLRAADSFHHPVGTCRIGAVVDEALRVKGVAGLRVIDASVFPGIPQAMTNAATIAVAERASDLVLAQGRVTQMGSLSFLSLHTPSGHSRQCGKARTTVVMNNSEEAAIKGNSTALDPPTDSKFA